MRFLRTLATPPPAARLRLPSARGGAARRGARVPLSRGVLGVPIASRCGAERDVSAETGVAARGHDPRPRESRRQSSRAAQATDGTGAAGPHRDLRIRAGPRARSTSPSPLWPLGLGADESAVRAERSRPAAPADGTRLGLGPAVARRRFRRFSGGRRPSPSVGPRETCGGGRRPQPGAKGLRGKRGVRLATSSASSRARMWIRRALCGARLS